MKHEVLYHRDAPWTVGETKAEREARIRAGTRAASEDCYRDTHPGRVISIRPVESDLPSLRNMADKDRPVVVLDIDDDERQGAASRTLKVEGDRLVPVTFDDRFGAVAVKLREKHADPEQWETYEATRVKTEEAENEKLRADHDRALEEYKALVETFPVDLHEWSMEDEGIPPAMPERPKAQRFIDVAPSRFDEEVARLSRSLAPTVTNTGTGLYSAKVTPTKLDRTQSGAPAGQVITFTAGGLGVAAAFAGGYITNVTRSQTRAIVSHIDDAATLEGDVTTWADTDDLDIFDSWSTIQAAHDQLFTDQGSTAFTLTQIIQIYDGTFTEYVTINHLFEPQPRYPLQFNAASGASPVWSCQGIAGVMTTTSTLANVYFDGIAFSGTASGNYPLNLNWNSFSFYFVNCTLTLLPSAGAVMRYSYAQLYFIDCELDGGVGAVQLLGLTFSNHAEFIRCNIHHYSIVGPSGPSTTLMEGCTVHDCAIVLHGGAPGAIEFRNNTFYNITNAVMNETDGRAHVVVQNNVFSTVAAIFKEGAVGDDALASPYVVIDSNCYHAVTKWYDSVAEPDITTFADWQALGYDANGFEADPLLTDPGSGDFSLQSASPCRNSGHGAGVVTGINDVAFDPYHPDIGAWSSGVCVAPPAPSVSATDLGNQADFKVDVVPDDEADVSTIFYQLVPNGLVQAWPTPITGTGSATITGQVGTYAAWATAVRCGLTSDSSTIDFVNVQAANEVTNIRTALREWVKGVVGNPAVDWRESNAPQSIRPYVTIKMGPILTVGSDYHGGNDDTGVETVAGDREFVFFIQVHGKQSDEDEGEVVSMLNRIRSSLEKRSVQATLGAASLAFVAVEGSSDLSGIGGTRWEARAFIDIRFNTTYSDTDDVGLISEVETPAGTLE